MPFEDTEKLRSPDDYSLDLTKLCKNLSDCNDKILRVHFWKHRDLRIKGWDIENGNIKNTQLSIVSLPKTKE